LLKLLESRRPATKFSGNSSREDFDRHLKKFERSVNVAGVSDELKIQEMGHWFSHDAEKMIQRFILRDDASEAYRELLVAMKGMWGMRKTTASEMLEHLLQGKSIVESDVSSTRSFLIELENVFQFAKDSGREDEFHRKSVHDEILSAKFPHWKKKWAEKRAKMSAVAASGLKFAQLSEFLHFRFRIMEEVAGAVPTTTTFKRNTAPNTTPMTPTTPTSQPARGRRNRGRQWSPRRVTSPPPSSTPTSSATSSAISTACLCCSAPHRLDTCSRFRLLPAQDKADIVRKNGLCFSCLEAGHTSRSCARSNACATCKGQHHSLLHEWSTANVSTRLQSNAAAI